MAHRHHSQPGMGTGSSEKNEPPFLETEIVFEQFVCEFPTMLLVLLLYNVVMNSTALPTVVCDVLKI
jgi:hypothetical protein